MSSLIGDPFWRAGAFVAQAVSQMSSSEIAGWVQAIGGILAIIATAVIAGRDGRRRKEESKEIKEAETEQRYIFYQIAEDVYREILNWRFNALNACVKGEGKVFFEGGGLDYMDSNLRVLDRIALERLPNPACAVDVQCMREYAYSTRFYTQLSKSHIDKGEVNLAICRLLTNIRRHAEYANVSRENNGPKYRENLNDHARYREFKGYNLEKIKETCATYGVEY